MTKTPKAAALMSSALALALVLGAVLPPEHMHVAGIEGRSQSIVHRHSPEGWASTPPGTSVAAHGDHHRALFLQTFYNSAARFVPYAPAVVDAVTFIAPPASPVAQVQPGDARGAHGPPGESSHTRAPPALTSTHS